MSRNSLPRAAKTIPVPQDRAACNALLAQLGDLVRGRAELETALAAAVAQVKAEHEAVAAPLNARIAGLHAAIQAWAEANRAALTNDGRSKSVELPAGFLRWRLTRPRVAIVGAKEVLALIRKNRRFRRFLRVAYAIDKDAMLKAPDLAARLPGVAIEQTEEFVVEPCGAGLAPAAAPLREAA